MISAGYLFLGVVLAALLDLALIRRARRDLARWGIDRTQVDRAVFVLGRYSAMLTWAREAWRMFIISSKVLFQQLKNPDSSPASDDDLGRSKTWKLPVKTAWLEWLVIGAAVYLYCAGILDLRAPTRLTGNEAEVFQMLDWVLVNSLAIYRQFPLWNPNLFTGLPYVADPMLHAYNPVVTLPVLLFGVRVGFKLAIFFSFMFAAFGMWRLGLVLGLQRPARLWMALLYAFAGQPAARFLQGQYLFILGFAWLPWILASLFLFSRTRRRLHLAQTALFVGLLFFSGNIYYSFYIFLASGIFVLVTTLNLDKQKPWLIIDTRLFVKYLGLAALVIGVVAIQLLPLVEFWPRLNKDLHLEGSHSLRQIFLDYTSKDINRVDAFQALPAREEFYAYIGLTPFIGLGLLLLTLFTKRKPYGAWRSILFFALLLGLSILWIGLDYLPWREAFLDTRFFLQFRHLLRMLLFGSLALIILAGFGLDTLWRKLSDLADRWKDVKDARWIAQVARIGILVMALGMIISVVDVYSTNRRYVRTQPVQQNAYLVMGWLRQTDPGVWYVRHNPHNSAYDAVLSKNLRFIDIWYHFADIRSLEGVSNRRYLVAQPHYVVQPDGDPPPTEIDAELVTWVEEYNVYRRADSLPMAFAVTNTILDDDSDSEWLQARDVTQFTAFFPGPNSVEVIADGGSSSNGERTLVVLVTHYPGWQVLVDDRPQELFSVGGYLGTQLLPGVHRYVFRYRPTFFFVGLLISLVSLGLTGYLMISDLQFDRTKIRQRWSSFVESVQGLRNLPQRWLPSARWEGAATVRQGAILVGAEIPEGAQVIWTVEPLDAAPASPITQAWRRWLSASLAFVSVLVKSTSLNSALFVAAIALYLVVRLVGLTQFPIYFFTDEAIQTLSAIDLLRNGLLSPDGEFLPTYFRNVDHFNLSTSVYLQAIPYLLFGKSVLVTRLTSVLATLLAAFSVGLILRDIFKLPYWWSAPLLLSATPAWFLHSRTAFEVVLMVSIYSAALYYYLMYRYREARYLYPALILFALAFYTYSPGQLIVVATGFLLLISDFRYHWQQRATAWRGVGLLVLLVLPYLRFRLMHPLAMEEHLVTLNSYLVQPLAWQEKLERFWREYRLGLSIGYWFIPNEHDLARHLMKGYGHLSLATLPFLIVGLAACLFSGLLKRFEHSSASRLILITLLVAPLGSALVHIAVTRALVMVIPASLLASLGLIYVLTGLEKLLNRLRWAKHWATKAGTVFALSVFFILALVNISMLDDALNNSPTWFQDYGLMGLQYGAAQVFSEAQQYVRQHPMSNLKVSPTWANGPDILMNFFVEEPQITRRSGRIELGSIDAHIKNYREIEENTVFVMTPEEYSQAVESGKFIDIRTEKTIPYPDGSPGFYFVRLSYVENIHEIMEAERMARRELVVAMISLDGWPLRVRHSHLDMGRIEDLFDGNRYSLARTLEANPFVLELTFYQSRTFSRMALIIGDTEIKLRVLLYHSASPEPLELIYELDGSVQNPQVWLDIPINEATSQPYQVSAMHLEILDTRQREPGHVHLWELTLKE
jgi:hypothetical protein